VHHLTSSNCTWLKASVLESAIFLIIENSFASFRAKQLACFANATDNLLFLSEKYFDGVHRTEPPHHPRKLLCTSLPAFY
jgi:hypothetical protein